MAIKDDLKNISSLVTTMEEQLRLLDSVNDSYITETIGFDLICKSKIKSIKDEAEIDAITERDLYDYFDVKDIEKTRDSYKEEEHDGKDFLSYMKEIIQTIYKGNTDFERLIEEKNKLIRDANKITDDYFSYINSSEYLEKRKERLNKMREEVEAQEDSASKKKSLREIDAMESAYTLNFLYDHINEEGEKEIKNITDIFFHSSRSKNVIDKFKSRMKRLGYKDTTFQQFFNIEEKFLPEEYHVFNNLFLFNAMRYISFTDPTDKVDGVQSSALLLKMHNLMNHNLPEDQKEAFIEFIKKYLDQFEPFRDIFKEKNATAPGHPERIAADKAYEQKYRLMIITSLQNMGVEVDTNLDTDVLRKQLEDLMKKNGLSVEGDEGSSEDAKNINEEEKKEETPEQEEATVEKTSEDAEEVLAEEESSEEPTEEPVDVEEETPAEEVTPEKVSEKVNELLDAIENSEEIDELDKFSESLGGTLIPEGEEAEDKVLGYAGVGTTNEEEKDDSMVVPVEKEVVENTTVIEKAEEEVKKEEETPNKEESDDIDTLNLDRYLDPYKCIYVQQKDGTYSYYEKDGVTLIEEGIPEDDILRLLSSGSITKVDA